MSAVRLSIDLQFHTNGGQVRDRIHSFLTLMRTYKKKTGNPSNGPATKNLFYRFTSKYPDSIFYCLLHLEMATITHIPDRWCHQEVSWHHIRTWNGQSLSISCRLAMHLAERIWPLAEWILMPAANCCCWNPLSHRHCQCTAMLLADWMDLAHWT